MDLHFVEFENSVAELVLDVTDAGETTSRQRTSAPRDRPSKRNVTDKIAGRSAEFAYVRIPIFGPLETGKGANVSRAAWRHIRSRRRGACDSAMAEKDR